MPLLYLTAYVLDGYPYILGLELCRAGCDVKLEMLLHIQQGTHAIVHSS
jgi:hypothetical protein